MYSTLSVSSTRKPRRTSAKRSVKCALSRVCALRTSDICFVDRLVGWGWCGLAECDPCGPLTSVSYRGGGVGVGWVGGSGVDVCGDVGWRWDAWVGVGSVCVGCGGGWVDGWVWGG